MKRIKAINGYTIYQCTARDEQRGEGIEGEYTVYISSDIRDFGKAFSYAEYEGIGSLEEAEEICKGSNFANAQELCEEYSTLTGYEEVREVERMLDNGASAEEVREYIENTDEEIKSSLEAPKTAECEEIAEEAAETPEAPETPAEMAEFKKRHERNAAALLAVNHFEAELYKLFPLNAGSVTPLAMELAEAVGKVKELINSDEFEIVRQLSEKLFPAQPQDVSSAAMFPDYVYVANGEYIKICEGDGSNLWEEDINNGYCDYLMYYVYDSREALEAGDDCDGGMLLLDKMAHEQFTSLADAVPLVNGMVFC